MTKQELAVNIAAELGVLEQESAEAPDPSPVMSRSEVMKANRAKREAKKAAESQRMAHVAEEKNEVFAHIPADRDELTRRLVD